MKPTPHTTLHITVANVVEHEQKFLFVEEISRGNRVISQPAGHLEHGESLLEAVIRETLEETACIVEPTHCLGVYQFTINNHQDTFIRFCFISRFIKTLDQPLTPPILQSLWLSYDELLTHQTPLRHEVVLQCLNKGSVIL